MSAVLLDTTVLIDLLRGRTEAARRLAALRRAGDLPFTSPVNVEETVRGLRPSERADARSLFAGLREARLGAAEAAEGWRAGEWRRAYAETGRTLAQADCLVAAAALSLGGRLATGNPKDFPMPELAVEHWPVGA
jgi:predicted nucleic acid-binding protein